MTNKIKKGTVIGIKIWDKERKQFDRFDKLQKLSVHYDSNIIRLTNNERYEFRVIKKK